MALPLTRLPGRLFWFGCVFLACSSGWGSTNSIWSTRVWQTDDGLPDNQVTAILQGPDGYLWVGTAVGLARFDGFHFTDFSYSNGSNNEDQGVSALLPARDGGLWVRSRRGVVFKLSRDFSQAGPAATNLPESRTLAVAEDQNDRLWVVSPDQLWQAKDGKAVHLSSHKTKL
jgi:ligand-binding sensor domain-containing protein